MSLKYVFANSEALHMLEGWNFPDIGIADSESFLQSHLHSPWIANVYL